QLVHRSCILPSQSFNLLIATMTFKTMCDEFNDVVISIDESNRLTTSEMKTPLKSLVGKKGAAVVVSPIAPSPSDSAGSSVSSSSSVGCTPRSRY
ncbi:MAG: hypothetical protein JZU63_00790, partial [Rhodoferax sp.]|nr:hypothetical protein [Rhodoferax sp.]